MKHSLSNQINSHVAVFTDRSHMYITENVYMALLGTTTEKVQINGMEYATKSFSKLLTFKEFQNQYPEKVWNENQNQAPVYEKPEGINEPRKPVNIKLAVKRIIKGMDNFINHNETTGKAEEAREQLQKQLI